MREPTALLYLDTSQSAKSSNSVSGIFVRFTEGVSRYLPQFFSVIFKMSNTFSACLGSGMVVQPSQRKIFERLRCMSPMSGFKHGVRFKIKCVAR